MPAGDGTLRGLRSLGPTVISAASMTLVGPPRPQRRRRRTLYPFNPCLTGDARSTSRACGFINRRLPIINHLVRTVIERHRSARDHLEHRETPWRYYHSTKLLG
jgi:hypothetical protein